MAFAKSFPKDEDHKTTWHQVVLSPYEEKYVEKNAREEHIGALLESMRDAREVFAKSKIKYTDSQLVLVALSLFNKRTSHVAYMKEEKCRELFVKRFSGDQHKRRKE